jgi:non-specific serine/threonine protein kinase
MTYAFVLSADGMRAVPARQKTLQNAIGWSYHLLTETEQLVYRRLAVFAGGWTLPAAQTICADDSLPADEIPGILSQLVEKSLVVQQETDGTIRYSMLVTIRQYAHDRLNETNEVDAVSDRHLAFFLQLAEELEPKLHGPTQAEALACMETEKDNFRAALRWGLDHDQESGVLLTGALWLFWFMHSHFIEARQWYEEALAVSPATSRFAQMRLYIGVASNAMGRSDSNLIRSSSEQSLALARELNNSWGISMSIHHLGPIWAAQGDPAQAQILLEEGLQVSRAAGHWAVLLYTLDDIGLLALDQKNYHQAELFFNEMRDLSQQHEEKWIYGHAISCLSELARSQKEYDKAIKLIRESLQFAIETGNIRLIAVNLHYSATVFNGLNKRENAIRLFGAANKLAKSIDLIFNSLEEESKTFHPPLSKDKFASLYAEGESLSMEQAIALAMSDE